MLVVTQVAEYLLISQSPIRKLIQRVQIPAVRLKWLMCVRRNDLNHKLHAIENSF